MSEPFNPAKYDQLQGMKLWSYAIEMAKSGNTPPNCVEYVKFNAARWDGQHLEMGLFFLSKVDSIEARREIARHLDHPLKHIRYTVLSVLDHMDQIDEVMLGMLEQRLEAETDDFEKRWIQDAYQRAVKKL